jgi:hypothetical protein
MYSEFHVEQPDLSESFKAKIRQIFEASERLNSLIIGLSEPAEPDSSRLP